MYWQPKTFSRLVKHPRDFCFALVRVRHSLVYENMIHRMFEVVVMLRKHLCQQPAVTSK